MNRVVPREELDDATLALANEIAKSEPFVVQTAKRAANRVWDVAGFRAAHDRQHRAGRDDRNREPPRRDEFRRITQHRRPQGGDRLAGCAGSVATEGV